MPAPLRIKLDSEQDRTLRELSSAKGITKRVKERARRWKRVRPCPPASTKPAQQQAKQVDLELLQQWAQLGMIVLKYLDESGCYCQSPTDYS